MNETIETAPTQPLMSGGETIDISWQEPKGFVWLSLKNALLTLLTFGIYSFWGKTEVRRRIWNAVRINGEPLEYTGTGWELFLGFVLVSLVLVFGLSGYLMLIAAIFGNSPNSPLIIPFMLLPYVLFAWLFGLAVYRTRRYRLRRTRWRGIRGTLAGSPVRFANTWFLSALAIPFTLGWAWPWREVKIYRALSNDTRIGSAALRFHPQASAKALYPPFALVWFTGVFIWLLLAGGAVMLFGKNIAPQAGIVTGDITARLSVYSLFALAAVAVLVYLLLKFHAFRLNWLAANTYLQQGRFVLNIRPGELFRLLVGNLFILVLSLGILMPVVQKRLARHFVQRLTFEGEVDLARIAQAGDKLEKSGEGLGEFFDVDAF